MRIKTAASAVLLAALLACSCAKTSVWAAGETPETKMQTEETVLSDEELAEYYRDSVFVGDSIMVGFRNYCAKQKGSFLNGIQFLAVGSYSAFNAEKPVTEKNVHPLYKGKKCQIWDAVPRMGAKRVFILLGMNDIGILGLEGARDQYQKIIGRVAEACPGVEIHILSTTYTLKDMGKAKLNNENIAQYNILLQEMAEENGWGYMNVADPISDGRGNLAAGNCSDGFIHLSPSAYGIWENVLRDYAAARQEETADTAEETETAADEPETETKTAADEPETETP